MNALNNHIQENTDMLEEVVDANERTKDEFGGKGRD